MPKPYLAKSLITLREEINTRWPHRDKTSDGWIGDAAHAARVSDHNPDEKGCVHAIDIDKDGVDTDLILRETIGDPRVNYVIFNREIYSRVRDFKAHPYDGANPHTHHIHVSILHTSSAENNTRQWITTKPATKPDSKPPVKDNDVTLDEFMDKEFTVTDAAARHMGTHYKVGDKIPMSVVLFWNFVYAVEQNDAIEELRDEIATLNGSK